MKLKNIFMLLLTILLVGLAYWLTQTFMNPEKPLSARKSPDLLKQADQLITEGKYNEALAIYDQLIQTGSNLGTIYKKKGDLHMLGRWFDEAANDYTMALKYGPTPELLAGRCNTFRLLARFGPAIADCEAAIKLDSSYTDSYTALAGVYLEQHDLDKAQSTIEKGLQSGTPNAGLYYMLYQIVNSQGNVEASMDALNKCIEQDPNYLNCYWERGYSYYSQGKIDEARNDFRQIVERGTSDKDGELVYRATSILDMMGGQTISP